MGMNTFEPVKTHIEPYGGTVEELLAADGKLLEDIKKYDYVIVYKYNGVGFYYAPSIAIDALGDFNELRAFNKDGELRVASFGGECRGRIRRDGDGEGDGWYATEIVDEAHLLWGDPSKNRPEEGGFTRLSEDRGTELSVPLTVPIKQRAFVTVRNYLSNSKDRFEFDDWRMVKLFAREADEYGK